MDDRIRKSDEEWRRELTPEQYAVCRQKGTEGAFTGRYWDCHEDGTYRWFWDRGVLTRDADGNPIRFIGCMTDISAQRIAEELFATAPLDAVRVTVRKLRPPLPQDVHSTAVTIRRERPAS